MIEEPDLKALLKAGGTAFPSETAYANGSTLTFSGMTLRDWFAGQALAGMMANGFVPNGYGGDYLKISQRGDDYKAQYSVAAYALADAMLAERSK